MACFPQISRSGLPDVNYELRGDFNFAYLILNTYLTQQPTFQLSVSKYWYLKLQSAHWSHSYNLGRQSKIVVWRVASLTERFVKNEPLWKPCLRKVEYIRCIISSKIQWHTKHNYYWILSQYILSRYTNCFVLHTK